MDKLGEVLVSLFGQAWFDALPPEAVTALTAYEDSQIDKAALVKALSAGAAQDEEGDGDIEIDLSLITDPELADVVGKINSQFTGLKTKLGDANTAATTAQADATQAKADAQAAKDELTGMQRSGAIDTALKDANVQDTKDFKAIYKDQLDALTVTDQGVEGLDVIIKDAQKSKAYLFKQDTKPPAKGKGGGFNPPGDTTPNTDGMSTAELLAYRKANRMNQ